MPRTLRNGIPFWLLLGAWLLLVLASIGSRSFVPIDETRYVTVAWNMWLRHDLLVPFLNGHPYSDKPPLMLWLYNLGWGVFGVNDWWPRLVAPLFGLGSLVLVRRLASRLWPEQPLAAVAAPALLLGSLFWTFYTTTAMFDMLLAFFTLLGICGVVSAWRHGGVRGWLVLALAIGLGVLSKGPVILMLVLPVALLAPWWMVEGRPASWGRWYLSILLAVLGGAALALAWAIPAAIKGGPAYADAIFWGQTANRVVNSFAHRRGVLWYLPLLPLLLFPWFVWPRLWGAVIALRGRGPESGTRLALAWLVPLFIAFSLISGKQLHYLLPLFPAFALLVARALADDDWPVRRDLGLPALGVAAVGAALLSLHWWWQAAKLPAWSAAVPWWWGLFLLFLALLLLTARVAGLVPRLRLLLGASVALVANVGSYAGEYQFLGRLTRPLAVINRSELRAWAASHPTGYVVMYGKHWPLSAPGAVYAQPYHLGGVGIWPARTAVPADSMLK